jgi:hypothetical protein
MIGAVARYPNGMEVYASEGQLMGHPLSFPLLCIINLACYRLAIMRWLDADASRLDDAKILWNAVLVNGDDMLYRGPPSFFEVFHKTTGQAGLKISLGKNYNSKHIALINSQLFVLRKGTMVRTGYLNQKLIYGESLKDGQSASTPDQIGKDVSEMVTYCDWAKGSIPRAFARWSSKWKGWFQPNWYLPVHLGGYGVSIQHAPEGWKLTRGQRKMAARFVSDPRLQLYRRTGFSLATAKFAGSLANFTMVPRFLSEDEREKAGITHQSAEMADDWLVRAAYFSRAFRLSQNKVADKVILLRTKSAAQRLKPMSYLGLGKWWHIEQVAFGVPACPPLGGIHGVRRVLKERLEHTVPVRSPFRRGPYM